MDGTSDRRTEDRILVDLRQTLEAHRAALESRESGRLVRDLRTWIAGAALVLSLAQVVFGSGAQAQAAAEFDRRLRELAATVADQGRALAAVQALVSTNGARIEGVQREIDGVTRGAR